MIIVTRAVTITTPTTAAVVTLTYHDVFPCRRTASSATPTNATTMPITPAVIRVTRGRGVLRVNHDCIFGLPPQSIGGEKSDEERCGGS